MTIADILLVAMFIVFSLVREFIYRKELNDIQDSMLDRHIKEVNRLLDVIGPNDKLRFTPRKKEDLDNKIMKENENEIMLNEIPFMEIPKDFKIEHEGGPETPAEAVAVNR